MTDEWGLIKHFHSTKREGDRGGVLGTCCVKKAQSIGFSSYHYCHCIVIKYLESEAGREREEGGGERDSGPAHKHMSTEPSLDYMHSITASGAEYSTRP